MSKRALLLPYCLIRESGIGTCAEALTHLLKGEWMKGRRAFTISVFPFLRPHPVERFNSKQSWNDMYYEVKIDRNIGMEK